MKLFLASTLLALGLGFSVAPAVSAYNPVSDVVTIEHSGLYAVPNATSGALIKLLTPSAHAQTDVSVVPGVTEPTTLEQAVGYLPTLIELAKNGKWLLFGALLTVVLTFFIRQWVLPKAGLNVRVLPLVSAALGALVGFCIAYLAGAAPLEAALATLSGPVGSLFWDAVLKYAFNAIAPAPPAVKV